MLRPLNVRTVPTSTLEPDVFISVSLFFKHWKKNYWDINHLPYYCNYEVRDTLFI